MTAVHVVPVSDGMTHSVPGGYDIPGARLVRGWVAIEAVGEDSGCVCVPAVECVPRQSGPDGWVVTHHSLDGRERDEQAS